METRLKVAVFCKPLIGEEQDNSCIQSVQTVRLHKIESILFHAVSFNNTNRSYGKSEKQRFHDKVHDIRAS